MDVNRGFDAPDDGEAVTIALLDGEAILGA
jgi:hypothetical protein